MTANIALRGSPEEGLSYTLACTVNGDESLSVSNTMFQWDRVSGGNMRVSRNPTLTFDPLLYVHEGEYRCTATITSPYLIETPVATETIRVTVSRKLHKLQIGAKKYSQYVLNIL